MNLHRTKSFTGIFIATLATFNSSLAMPLRQVADTVNSQEISADSIQQSTFRANLRTETGFSTNGTIPFWLRSNTFGSIPLDGPSVSFIPSIVKPYNPQHTDRKFDWSAGVSVRLNVGEKVRAIPFEAYVKGKLGIFELSVGRMKDFTGLVDSTLSSGAFSISGNALGIPKISLAIKDFTYIPFTKKLLSFRGNIDHGYFGTTPINSYVKYTNTSKSMYHQLAVYGRIGKPHWRLKLLAGINHQVMYGQERKIFGPDYGLSDLGTFWHVLIGKEYGNSKVPTTKIGEHLGSIDQMIQYDFGPVFVQAYHQFFYTTGGLYYLNNVKDGLWGLSITNKARQNRSLYLEKIVIEFMNSKSQGGEIDAPKSSSGAETYYQSMYAYGWSYKNENLGSNFLTNRRYARKNLVMRDNAYIINNRVQLLHMGIVGHVEKFRVLLKCSFSNNYGTYATSPIGVAVTSATNEPAVIVNGRKRLIYPGPYFEKVSQVSGIFDISRSVNRRFDIGLTLAGDSGKLLENSGAAFANITYKLN